MRYLKWGLVAIIACVPSWAEAYEDIRFDTLHNATAAVGAGKAIVVERFDTVGLQSTLTGTASVTPEVSVDGLDYFPASCTTAPVVATGVTYCSTAGMKWFRARVTSFTSGTISIESLSSTGNPGVAGSGGGGGGGLTNAELRATPVPVTEAVSGAGFFAVKRDDIAASSVNTAFGFTSKKVAVSVPNSNTADVCVDWIGGTAVCPAANTSGDARLAPGTAIIMDAYSVTSLSFISDSGTQTVTVQAWQ